MKRKMKRVTVSYQLAHRSKNRLYYFVAHKSTHFDNFIQIRSIGNYNITRDE